MELNKGKYKKAQVEQILEENALKYKEKILELETKVAELSHENRALKADVNALKSKEELVLQTLTNAEKSAKDSNKAIENNYLSCVNSLKVFSSKWENYFKYVLEKYPYYPAIKQASTLKNELDKLIRDKTDNKTITKELKKSLGKKEQSKSVVFSPKDKIQEYVAITSDNGFNLDEVLNPGNLRLEDLCKELGLLEENE